MKTKKWVITDPSCNQRMKEIKEDRIYEFEEDRIIDPVTGKKEKFNAVLDYEDYDWFELVDACAPFGYMTEQVDKWITEGEEIPLMLECIFEQLA